MEFKEMMVWNNKEHCNAEQIILLKQELAVIETKREKILKTIAHLEHFSKPTSKQPRSNLPDAKIRIV